MDPVLGFLLGLVQGVAEWLPVSSEGMVGLAASWAGIDDWLPLAFFLHLGTALAVVLRMRADVLHVVRTLPRWRDEPLTRFVLITTAVSLPVGLAVVLALDRLLGEAPGERPGVVVTLLVGALLIVTGLVLRSAAGRMGGRKVADTSAAEGALLGLLQGLAALPGISRSGMTVSALLMRRVEGDEAVRLSFVMSVPVVVAAAAYEAVWGEVGGLGWEVLVAGVAASFVFGYLTLDALLRLSRSMRWDWFCVAFGLLAMAAGVVLLL